MAAKRPNAWGLYDLHGNAWEWCANWYDGAPAGENGPFRAVRGGSWGAPAARARSANRGFDVPGHRGIGLRVLLEAAGAPE